jgi:hypothetical protein
MEPGGKDSSRTALPYLADAGCGTLPIIDLTRLAERLAPHRQRFFAKRIKDGLHQYSEQREIVDSCVGSEREMALRRIGAHAQAIEARRSQWVHMMAPDGPPALRNLHYYTDHDPADSLVTELHLENFYVWELIGARLTELCDDAAASAPPED